MQKIFGNRRAVLATAIASIAALGAVSVALAQQKVAIVGKAPAIAHKNKRMFATLIFEVPAGFHIYGPKFKGVGTPTTVKLAHPVPGIKVMGVEGGAGLLSGKVMLKVPIWVGKVSGIEKLPLIVRYQQCNDRICLPPTDEQVLVTTRVR